MLKPSPTTPPIAFDNSYARLPARFFAPQAPSSAPEPRLIRLNAALAVELGIDPAALSVDMLSGNRVPDGAEPIAMAYAGHQFGNWAPQLGDGRAVLLGEVIGRDGIRRDIQLKGAGRTPFSRRGDGKAALGPVLREYIVSEAMAALGIRTTRALAAVTTGERIFRDDILPGAILTRVAQSHVRIGTFEYFGNRGDTDGVRVLTDYMIDRHYPEAAKADNPTLAFFEAVIGRVAELVASWQSIGFIHGVMNTDNMSIAGETIDYGPCAFMDTFDPATVYSSIDTQGRYAYGNQPQIAHWNLSRLAGALAPLLDADQDAAIKRAQDALNTFPARFDAAYLGRFRQKLGLTEAHPDDAALIRDFLADMAEGQADFTLTFRRLGDHLDEGAAGMPDAVKEWTGRWRSRLAREDVDPATRKTLMRAANPAFIPRNHRIEAVIRAAQTEGDFTPMDRLMTVLATPFDDQVAFAEFADPPLPDEVVLRTFCGT
jgi:uncharacterized protein YdiU (UPF0061 family)